MFHRQQKKATNIKKEPSTILMHLKMRLCSPSSGAITTNVIRASNASDPVCNANIVTVYDLTGDDGDDDDDYDDDDVSSDEIV